MVGGYLLDTDVLIDMQRNHPPAMAWFAARKNLPPVAGIAALEIAFVASDRRKLEAIERFLKPFDLLWPHEADMRSALLHFPRVRLSAGIGLLDSMIAATAISHNLAVATFNTRHFDRIPAITTVKLYER